MGERILPAWHVVHVRGSHPARHAASATLRGRRLLRLPRLTSSHTHRMTSSHGASARTRITTTDYVPLHVIELIIKMLYIITLLFWLFLHNLMITKFVNYKKNCNKFSTHLCFVCRVLPLWIDSPHTLSHFLRLIYCRKQQQFTEYSVSLSRRVFVMTSCVYTSWRAVCTRHEELCVHVIWRVRFLCSD